MSLANWPPLPPDSHNDLLANQNHLRSSRYVSNPPQLSTSSILISINKYLAFLSTKKTFFQKNLIMIKKFVLKSPLFLRLRLLLVVFLNFTNSQSCAQLLQLYTGLPTKEETSETTVQNLYCQFLHDSLQLKTFLFLCQIIK